MDAPCGGANKISRSAMASLATLAGSPDLAGFGPVSCYPAPICYQAYYAKTMIGQGKGLLPSL